MNTLSIRRLVMLLFLILLVAVPMTATAKDNGSGKVRVYVEFSAGHKNAVRGALNRAGAQFHYDFDELNSFVVSLPEAALNGIARNPNVVSVEEDPPRYLVEPASRVSVAPQSDTESTQEIPYGVELVQAPLVWAKKVKGNEINGAGRTVCIIDTGYWPGHEDLPDDVDGESQIEEEEITDDGNGHGSHVAGTIVGEDNGVGVVGVAPGADLFIVKIFDKNGEWVAYSSDLVDAANTCADNGADIISMSLSGTTPSSTEKKAFASLYDDQGILSIAAASNDGVRKKHYPASYDSVVSVAAIDESLNYADFSQYNNAVELAAPGVAVLSTVPFLATDKLVVDDVEYDAHGIEYSPYGTASGALVDGGRCLTAGDWNDENIVVLCERGDISFYEKVMNVQAGGGVAAVIYNNEPDNFWGTLGEVGDVEIPAISLSQEDGQYLVANALGAVGDVTHLFDEWASGYEAWDGTSMATPHVSGVAALIWSAYPNKSNVEIRNAMQDSALDLGDPGRDVHYGYGLVQALDALDILDKQ